MKTQGELAARLGVSRRTVIEYLHRGMPGRPGAYRVKSAQHWVMDNGLGGKRQQSVAGDETAHARLARLKGDQVEIEIAQAKRELVAVEPHVRRAVRVVTAMRARLDQLPDELLAEVAEFVPEKRLAEIRERLRIRVEAAYAGLAEICSREVLRGESDPDSQDEETAE